MWDLSSAQSQYAGGGGLPPERWKEKQDVPLAGASPLSQHKVPKDKGANGEVVFANKESGICTVMSL